MKNLCMYGEETDTVINNKPFNTIELYTINLDNQNKGDKERKGLIPVVWNLKESVTSLLDFEELPGLYDVITENIVDKKGKGRKVTPKEVKLIKKLELPTRQDNAVLILGAKLSKLQSWQGITIWYSDPKTRGRSGEITTSRGIPIIQESIENKGLGIITKVPAWYEIETSLSRGKNGEEIEKIKNVKFIADFDMRSFLGLPPEQTKPPGT